MRKLFIAAICGTAILLISYTGYRSYKTWKQRHMLTLARAFIAKSDPRNAILSVSQALKSNPANLEASRLMAELSEVGRLPNALAWRGRVVELNPHSLEDRIALANTALRMGDIASANRSLEGADSASKQSAAYHNMAGTVAATARQVSQAESHFAEAARLEPQNPLVQLNLAVLRLGGTNATVLAEARQALKHFSTTQTNLYLRCQALRELTVDAVRSGQTNDALEISGELLRQPNAGFQDHLIRLEVLRRTAHAEFKTSLVAIQKDAANSATNSAKIYELATWEISRLGPQEALVWLLTLGANIQTNQPAAMLISECQMASQDWRGLQKTLDQENWGDLECVRRALRARSLYGQDLRDSAKGEWGLALKAANGQKQNLIALLKFATEWNWLTEGEEILWSIVNQHPTEQWATRALSETLYLSGRTRSLLTLYTQQIKRTPSDLAIKNNLAMTALLLDAKELNPNALAREVYEQAPTNSNFASTYAFSLHTQKKNDEALKVFQQFKTETLENPGISGYYGLVLQATGNGQQAKKYLELTSKSRMLPEERKLFDKARAGG